MSERELLRKKEMQDRAFIQWVTKKNEEEKVLFLPVYFPCYFVLPQARKAAIKQQEELKLEHQRQKILLGKAAYSQWIKAQKEKDILLLKQRRRDNGKNLNTHCSDYTTTARVTTEQARLDYQQHLENKRKVQEAYENWKTQKDLEQRLSQLATDNDEPVKSNLS